MATRATTALDTVQTLVVIDAKLTVKPEEAVAPILIDKVPIH
jgi:hypothetical protein